MTFIAKVRVALVCAGIVVFASMVVARAKEARSARVTAASESATRVSPHSSLGDFVSVAEHYWR